MVLNEGILKNLEKQTQPKIKFKKYITKTLLGLSFAPKHRYQNNVLMSVVKTQISNLVQN